MNLDQLLTEQHADYEADLEPTNYGLDPFDTTTPTDLPDTVSPCSYCCSVGPCGCIDRDAPFGHHTARQGW